MDIRIFKKMLSNNNAIRLNKEWILFNDLELYNFDTEESIQFNSFDDLLKHPFLGDTFENFILNNKEFYSTFDGGSGNSRSGKMGGGFNHADQRGKKGGAGDEALGKAKYPAEFNAITGGRYKSYDKTLAKFNEKYADADTEYGITIDEQGYVHRHIAGDRTSVAISGSKGQMVVHNHPSGGNFSDSDLISIASESSKGIVATGTKKTYTFTKTKNFKSKEFIKAVKKAKWPVEFDYNKGADWWLRQNAKKYGYKYTAQKPKGIKNK